MSEDYTSILDAIVRDKKTAQIRERDRKMADEKAEQDRVRKILEPLITVLDQIKQRIEGSAYVYTDRFGKPECRISARSIYAKFNGVLSARVNPGEDQVTVIRSDYDDRNERDRHAFATAAEAIPMFLEAAANMMLR
jgi:hypothetical protein